MTDAKLEEEVKFEPEPAYIDGLDEWPNFKIMGDQVDGILPTCRIADWAKFETILADGFHDRMSGDVIYRGQRRHDWQLAPTLTRQFDGGAIDAGIAHRLLRRFALAMRGRGTDLDGRDDNEIWAFGQHFGLATPLLDWTESPFVALFFAFAAEDPIEEKANASRAVFCLNRSAIAEVMPELFFEPALGENGRLVNQAGLFTVTSPGGDNLDVEIINRLVEDRAVDPEDANGLAKFIAKIHIPNAGRVACLNMLRKMNIHHANLFPDPGGASLYCNDWLDGAVREKRRIEEHAAAAARDPSKPSAEQDDLPVVVAPTLLPSVEEVLKQSLREDERPDPGVLADWARRIDDRYRDVASLDWYRHSAATARLTVEFKRLLSLLSWPTSSRGEVIDRLLRFYEEAERKVET